MTDTMTDTMGKGNLKRLDFVRSYSGAAMSKANDLGNVSYSKTKQLLPGNLQAQFEKLMTKLGSTASPMLAKVSDTSGQVLSVVDHQVRGRARAGWRACGVCPSANAG
jgi:hypothetical protein